MIPPGDWSDEHPIKKEAELPFEAGLTVSEADRYIEELERRLGYERRMPAAAPKGRRDIRRRE